MGTVEERVGNRRHTCSFDLHDDELPFGTRENVHGAIVERDYMYASNALSTIVSS